MAALTFRTLARADFQRLTHFASVPLAGILRLSREAIEATWLEEMTALLSSPSAEGIAIEAGGRLCGMAVCVALPWESRLLDKSMCAIRYVAADGPERRSLLVSLITEVERRVRKRGVEFLLCKTDSFDPAVIHALELDGFCLMDSLLGFVLEVRRSPNPDGANRLSEGLSIRPATSDDSEALMKVARVAFSRHFGRFHADPRIASDKATQIYEEWIRSCINGWADLTLVAVHEHRIVGYLAWKDPSAMDLRHGIRVAHHSIAGIDPAFAGRGVFTALIQEGVRLLRDRADYIEGATHIDHHAVQRAYLRLGWQIASAQHSFHKWLAPT